MIDVCQYLLHTGQVSNSAVSESPVAVGPLASQCCAPLLREPITAGQAADLARPPGAPARHPTVFCTPLRREPITAGQAADLARTLKALADPTRLRLVSMVAV